MPFPKVKRVLYKKNPLEKVICQLRFPPILKIDAELPAEFQDRVRQHFPNYAESSELKLESATEARGQAPPELLRQALRSSGGKNYEFSSEGGHWTINLTRTFVSLATTQYERWEELKEKLEIPLNALIDIYSPSHFSRIGLRYIDVIRRSSFNLSDVDWSEFLQPYILGVAGVTGLSKHIKSFESVYEVKLSDGQSVVRVITRFVEATDDGEICYVIDSDFCDTNQTEIGLAIERLDYFNTRSSRLIQWCITKRLHEAMEPQTL